MSQGLQTKIRRRRRRPEKLISTDLPMPVPMEELRGRSSDVLQVDQHQPSLTNGGIDHRCRNVPPEADLLDTTAPPLSITEKKQDCDPCLPWA